MSTDAAEPTSDPEATETEAVQPKPEPCSCGRTPETHLTMAEAVAKLGCGVRACKSCLLSEHPTG